MPTSHSEARKDTWRSGGHRLAFWFVALATALAAGPAPGAEPRQLTTRQMEALSPEEADKIVREDLLSILQPVGQIHQGHSIFLRVGLTTRGFNTEYRGLCRRDVVRLRYAPVDDVGPRQDRPLRPFGIEAQAQFALRGAPPLARRLSEPNEVWGADCERVGDDAVARWFDAPSNLDAARALNLLDATTTRLRAGTPPALCRGSGCNLITKDLKPEGLVEILSCATEPGKVCYRYHMQSAALITVVARDEGEDADVSPDDVLTVGSEVIVD